MRGGELDEGEQLIGRGKRVALGLSFACAALGLVAPVATANHGFLDQVSISPVGGNGSLPSVYLGNSADGTHVFYRTGESMASSDTDPQQDVYDRFNGATTDTTRGNSDTAVPLYRANSTDGSHVFFETGEQLDASDNDGTCIVQQELQVNCPDVYEGVNGATHLISTGPAGTNGSYSARYRGSSDDGTHVFFTTREKLVAHDTDDSYDVYERTGGTTSLVSIGPAGGNGAFPAFFKDCSADGSHVFILTNERLTSSDTDSNADVYERTAGTTTLVSTGPAGGNGAVDAAFRDASASGGKVFFETAEALTSADTDTSSDVYERSGGTTTLASTGPAGGNGATDAFFVGDSRDGSRVWIETKEGLVAGDTDGRQDVYQRSAGTTTLVSTGPSGGNGAADAAFQGASDDGARVLIGTREALAPTDTDSSFDLYERFGGATTQVSQGTTGGNGSYDAYFDGESTDGTRVFFESFEPLTSNDTDSSPDVYERYAGVTTLISAAPSGSGSYYATFMGASDDGTRVFFDTADPLVSSDTDAQVDVYEATAGNYARPKGATPLSVPLVIAYRDCTAPNTVHGPPALSTNPTDASCAPPVQSSDWLVVGTPDSNGQASNGTGKVRFESVVGNAATPADEADLRLKLSLTDVRRKSDLSDYAGEVQTKATVRITDKANGGASVPAIVTDIPFSWDATCSPTTDTTIGSACAVTTSADALMPGAITEGARSVWEVSQVEVLDGGSDGDTATAPNTVFERQGIFVP